MDKAAQNWLKYARQDLQAAKVLFETNNLDFYRNIGFHCQQSTEKTIKAFLVFKKIKFGKIHDLKLLGEEVVRIEASLKPLMVRTVTLIPFAVEFRYPESADKSISDGEIKDALSLTEEVLKVLSSFIF